MLHLIDLALTQPLPQDVRIAYDLQILGDPAQTGVVIVASPEEMPSPIIISTRGSVIGRRLPLPRSTPSAE